MSAARSYEARSLIEATPAQVWATLTDVAAWPDWDSGVNTVEGELALGAKLTISVEANVGRSFAVTVKELSAPSRMVFRGGMPLNLFVGQRTYSLEPEDNGTRFTMREEYTGPLAGMITKRIPDLSPSFQQFADGLKEHISRRPSP